MLTLRGRTVYKVMCSVFCMLSSCWLTEVMTIPSLFGQKITDQVLFVTLLSYHNLRRWLILSDFASKVVRAISSHL